MLTFNKKLWDMWRSREVLPNLEVLNKTASEYVHMLDLGDRYFKAIIINSFKN